MEKTTTPELFGEKEAAYYLGVTITSLRQYCFEKKIIFAKKTTAEAGSRRPGRRPTSYFFTRDALDAFRKEHAALYK